MSENDFIYNNFKQGFTSTLFWCQKSGQKSRRPTVFDIDSIIGKNRRYTLGPRFAPKARHSFLFSIQQKRKETKEKPLQAHIFFAPILSRTRLHGIFGFLLWISMNIADILIFQVFLCSALLLVYQICVAPAENEDQSLFKLGALLFFQELVSVLIAPFPKFFCYPVFMSFKLKITC